MRFSVLAWFILPSSPASPGTLRPAVLEDRGGEQRCPEECWLQTVGIPSLRRSCDFPPSRDEGGCLLSDSPDLYSLIVDLNF